MTMERIGSIPIQNLKRRRLPLMSAGSKPDSLGLAKNGAAATAVTVDEAVEDAITRGYRDGFAEGITMGEGESERLLRERVNALEEEARQRLQAAVAECDKSRAHFQKLIGSMQQEVHVQRDWAEQLAIEIAYTALLRLLGEKAQERTLLAALCHHASAELASAPTRIRLAPVDVELVAGLTDEVEVVADPRLMPGSLVLGTPRGEVHAGLEIRLEAIKRALLEALAASAGRDHGRGG